MQPPFILKAPAATDNNIEMKYIQVLVRTFVAFHIKELVVPWHQFVYTLFIPSGRLFIQPASLRSSFAKRLPERCSFIFGNRKKFDCARSGLYGGCSKMSQWNCLRSKANVCRAVCGSALSCNRTVHARACLFGKITKISSA